MNSERRMVLEMLAAGKITADEAEKIFQEVSGRISEDAMMKWGARIDNSMQKSAIKIMVVMGGVEFADYSETGIARKLEQSKSVDLDKIFEDEEK